MGRRLCDVVLATVALVLVAPVLAVAVLVVRCVSPGPGLHRARRVGRHGEPFTLYKLRTMELASAAAMPITSHDDPRVFSVGRRLREWKIDELPQLFNVIRGDMSIIGPRPEDPDIVRDHYTRSQLETLTVRPGLASPGSLYNFTHGERCLTGEAAVERYLRELLPLKLALDLEYVRAASAWYDVRLIGRTMWVIAARACGRRTFRDPPELRRLQRHAPRAGEPGGLPSACPPTAE